jgi:hypothetical protein
MRVFVRSIERSLNVAIDRLQRGDACEFERSAVFGRLRQKVGRRQDLWHIMLGFGNDLGEVRDCFAQRREFATIRQHYGFSEPQAPGHNATPQQNRTQAQYRPIRSGPRQTIHQPPYFVFSAGNPEGR